MEAEEFCKNLSEEYASQCHARFRLSLRMVLLLTALSRKRAAQILQQFETNQVPESQVTELLTQARLLSEFIHAAEKFFSDALNRYLTRNN